MRFYLDDDSAAPLQIQLLRKAGHDVQVPSDVGLAGRPDAAHLRQAIRSKRVCLSRNYDDFESLHLLVREVQGHHSGIFVIRRDNDPRRNLAPRDVVRAIRKLQAAGLPLADELHILNQWQ